MGIGNTRVAVVAAFVALIVLSGTVAGTVGAVAPAADANGTDGTTLERQTANEIALEGQTADGTTLEGQTASSLETATTQDDGDLVQACAANPPDDFAAPADGNETIGWFDGYWYNQPLEVDASDGLTQAELEKVSARTAARIEALRCLSFETLPPVEIVDRETFAEESAGQYEDVDQRTRQFDNAQFETLLLIGSNDDAVDVRQADRSATVGGYYDYVNDEIVVISENSEQLQLDEAILAHELGHALQDQHFPLEEYVRNTTDRDNAVLGVIEGDTHRMEQQYLEYCENDRWNEPCILDDGVDGGEGEQSQAPPNWGLYFMQFQPYSDGPSFVQSVHDEGGWDAVNALYDDMPDSAVEVIYPERYGEFEANDLDVPDRSSDDWDRLAFEEGPNYNVIGQAGLSAMFMDPAYDGTPVVPPESFLNLEASGEINTTNPLNYDLEPTSGWQGDKLYAYENGNGETATVWALEWEDANEAATFVETYERLIDVRGGDRVDGTAHTYAFGDGSEFDMALTIYPEDDRLLIVTAPTVDDLTAVHDDIEVLEDGESPLLDGNGETDDSNDSNDSENDADGDDLSADESTDDSIPGFGIGAAVSTLLLSFAGLARFRRNR
ncbi:Hvo_1808 family surface protein [Natronosalvus halobius]|uniref:Hvo_1808 family surface protein n=1 Tax=Natronosalvus halobius TaxID=2953746 RepID=UPI00209ED83A|nr:Hvo_1808 family surface protein [Natronosalvus halobius]USZ71324.1 Hvo_1808 family surface protein [Natronosalvus halobius]